MGGKRVVKFWKGESGVLDIVIINFTSRLLFELLFRCRMKDAVSLIFNLIF